MGIVAQQFVGRVFAGVFGSPDAVVDVSAGDEASPHAESDGYLVTGDGSLRSSGPEEVSPSFDGYRVPLIKGGRQIPGANWVVPAEGRRTIPDHLKDNSQFREIFTQDGVCDFNRRLSHEEVCRVIKLVTGVSLFSQDQIRTDLSDEEILKVLAFFGEKAVNEEGKQYLLTIFKKGWESPFDSQNQDRIRSDVDDTLLNDWHQGNITFDPLGFLRTTSGILEAVNHFVFKDMFSSIFSQLQNTLYPDPHFVELWRNWERSQEQVARIRFDPRATPEKLRAAVEEQISCREKLENYERKNPDWRVPPVAGGMHLMTQMKPQIYHLARFLRYGATIDIETDNSHNNMYRHAMNFAVFRAIVLGLLPFQEPSEVDVLCSPRIRTVANHAKKTAGLIDYLLDRARDSHQILDENLDPSPLERALPGSVLKLKRRFESWKRGKEKSDGVNFFASLPDGVKQKIAGLLFGPKSHKRKDLTSLEEWISEEKRPVRILPDNSRTHISGAQRDGHSVIRTPDRVGDPVSFFAGSDPLRPLESMVSGAAQLLAGDARRHGLNELANWYEGQGLRLSALLNGSGTLNNLPSQSYGEDGVADAFNAALASPDEPVAEDLHQNGRAHRAVRGIRIQRVYPGKGFRTYHRYAELKFNYESSVKESKRQIGRLRKLFALLGELGEVKKYYEDKFQTK